MSTQKEISNYPTASLCVSRLILGGLMKYYILVFTVFLFTGCVDDRGCWEWESQEECDARINPQPEDATVSVYRCVSNQTTIDESRMALITAGLDVISSNCADLTTPITDGAEACVDNRFMQVDIHIIPYESRFDALAVENFNYQIIYSSQYTVKACM